MVTPRVRDFAFDRVLPGRRRRAPAHDADRPRPLRHGLCAATAPGRGPAAVLRDRRKRVLMRRPAVVALVGLLLAPGAPAAAPPFDALLGVVEGRTIAASDIALARALGVLGFAPSTSPITREEIERFADVLLIDRRGGPDRHQRRAGADRAGLDGSGRAGGRRSGVRRAGSTRRALERGVGPPARGARGRPRAVLRGALRRLRVPGRGGGRAARSGPARTTRRGARPPAPASSARPRSARRPSGCRRRAGA